MFTNFFVIKNLLEKNLTDCRKVVMFEFISHQVFVLFLCFFNILLIKIGLLLPFYINSCSFSQCLLTEAFLIRDTGVFRPM